MLGLHAPPCPALVSKYFNEKVQYHGGNSQPRVWFSTTGSGSVPLRKFTAPCLVPSAQFQSISITSKGSPVPRPLPQLPTTDRRCSCGSAHLDVPQTEPHAVWSLPSGLLRWAQCLCRCHPVSAHIRLPCAHLPLSPLTFLPLGQGEPRCYEGERRLCEDLFPELWLLGLEALVMTTFLLSFLLPLPPPLLPSFLFPLSPGGTTQFRLPLNSLCSSRCLSPPQPGLQAHSLRPAGTSLFNDLRARILSMSAE